LSGEPTLRPVAPADLDVLFEFGRDRESVQMAAFTHKDPSDRAAFDAHWRRLLGDPTIRARVIVEDGRVVGSIVSWPEDGMREITYWIAREHWGRGVATRALTAFLAEETSRPLLGRAAQDNAGSIRVLEKCGFRLVSEGKWFSNARGAEIDEVALRLDGDPPPEATD
jgi:RimJ/RimL family protein N-acetyltransferase